MRPDEADHDRRLNEARDRTDVFLDELDHLGIEDVELVSLPSRDAAGRAAARSAAVEAAERAGRGRLLSESRELARRRVIVMYDRNMYQPTWAGLNWGRSLGTVEDRVAVAAAVEDAAIGTVALDLISEDQARELLEPLRLIVAIHASHVPPRSQFAARGWTGRIGVLLFLGIVASFASFSERISGTSGGSPSS